MSQGNSKFTERLSAAIAQLQDDQALGFIECVSGSLFSPILRNGEYEWAKVMDSDGLLVAEREVQPGEGRAPGERVSLLLAVIFQSEASTSQTKPNPLGKAALGHLPNGIWVDTTTDVRRRIDRLMVLFVLPKGAAPGDAEDFKTAKRNVRNAADMMLDTHALEVGRGTSAVKLAKAVKKRVLPFFKD